MKEMVAQYAKLDVLHVFGVTPCAVVLFQLRTCIAIETTKPNAYIEGNSFHNIFYM